MTEHLWDRLNEAATRLAPVQSQYRVVFELPNQDGPAGILVPDPNWLAAALEGGVLPPIQAYMADMGRMYEWMAANPGRESEFSWDKVGGALHPYAEPIGPMTEEQAIEYLILKDLPPPVWSDYGRANRPRFKIVRTESIPVDRLYRDGWRIAA